MTLVLSTYSMSDVVLIDVHEFYFTSALFVHHPTNQIPSERVQGTRHEPKAVSESQLSCDQFYLTQRHLAFTYIDIDFKVDVLFITLGDHLNGTGIKFSP